tara:strand:- start:2407 stop:2574 length:168 start_codon:yes stop_codon:yes gene_type:complete
VEEYSNSPFRKRRKPGNRVTAGHDNDEKMHALKMLQRSLAERIREHQQGPANRST